MKTFIRIFVGFLVIGSCGFLAGLLYRMRLTDIFILIGAVIMASTMCYAVGDMIIGMVNDWIEEKKSND